MPGLYSRLKVWITNEVLTAADIDAEFDNVKTNATPQMLDDYSTDATQMRIQTSPGAQGSESLATSTSGELERLRYVINRITGGTYWYDAPAASISNLNTSINNISPQPYNRITTGRMRASPSAFPIILQPAGSTNSVTIKADSSTNLLTYFINNVQYTLTADVTLAGLSTAPSANNTALITNNLGKTDGEVGTNQAITINTVGTAISNLVGKYAAFKIGNEYFIGRVATSTTISDCFRGFFFDSSDAPIPRVTATAGDTLTLMNLSYVFLTTTGTADVTYNQPYYLFDTPSGAATGDYWFDLYNKIWKKFNGSTWSSANATLIGVCIQNTTATIGARSQDLYQPFSSINNIQVYKDTNNIVLSRAINQAVSVNGSLFDKDYARWSWDMSADRDSGVSDSSNTAYYMYVTNRGDTVISDIAPYYRPGDLLGYYHPYQMWRAVAGASNDGSSDFIVGSVFNYKDAITATMINGSTVATSPNIAVSLGTTDFSTSSISFTDITTVPSITFTTRGNPVMVMVTGVDTYNATGFEISNTAGTNANLDVQILRDSTSILTCQTAGGLNPSNTTFRAPPTLYQVDFPGPGTFVYKLQMKVDNAASTGVAYHLKLIVYEMR